MLLCRSSFCSLHCDSHPAKPLQPRGRDQASRKSSLNISHEKTNQARRTNNKNTNHHHQPNTSPFIVPVWIKPLRSWNILFMTFRILFYIVLQLSNSRECMKVMAVLEMMDEAPCAPHCLQPMSHLLISSAKTDRQLPGISSQSTRLFIFFFFRACCLSFDSNVYKNCCLQHCLSKL